MNDFEERVRDRMRESAWSVDPDATVLMEGRRRALRKLWARRVAAVAAAVVAVALVGLGAVLAGDRAGVPSVVDQPPPVSIPTSDPTTGVEDPTSVPTAPSDPSEQQGAAGWLLQTRDAGDGTGDLPPVLVADGADVVRLHSGRVEILGTVSDGTVGNVAGDGAGTVVVERIPVGAEGPTELLRVDDGTLSPLGTAPATELHLYDVVHLDGVPHALYGLVDTQAGEEPSGDLVLHDLAGSTARTITNAFEVEFFTHAASAAGGVVVSSAYSDLTETFSFHRVDGTIIEDFHNPTENLPYNMPPLLTDAVLSPDAERLAYLSGPDWDGERGLTVGRWKLIVASRAGEELVRLALGGQEIELTALDFDGRWALISWRDADGTHQPPVLVDTEAADPIGHLLTAAAGPAGLDVTVEAN